MSKGPGKKPQSKTNHYSTLKLSSDARIIVALLKQQPQSQATLIKNADLTESTFYRTIGSLQSKNLVKRDAKLFALWNYDPIEKKIKEFIKANTRDQNYWRVSLDSIAYEAEKPFAEIEPLVYRIVKELGLKIVPMDGGQKYICR